ncbi:MAG: prepilin peptidase [Candidatus Saccharimonadales bacterium]
MLFAVFILGLIIGSFINALVWRIHAQSTAKKGSSKKDLSILKGRSMCPNCKHVLQSYDLIPIFSWLFLRGKCRYCSKPISVQYPLVELITGIAFVFSYIYWPKHLVGTEIIIFSLWLCITSGLIALTVYDIKWMLLPSRLIYPLYVFAIALVLLTVHISNDPTKVILNYLLSSLIGGGIFYVLYQVSDGRWIGGGDVRLGWLLGLIVATPSNSVLMLSLASFIGLFITIPLLLTKRIDRKAVIPFGPFLITGCFIVVLFGTSIITWYQNLIIQPK